MTIIVSSNCKNVDCSQTSCKSSYLDKNTCKVSKGYGLNLCEELRSQDIQCLYSLVEVEPKND